MVKSGRNGQVLYDPAGITPVLLTTLKAWQASFKTEYYDTTRFGALNRTKVPGLPDISGSGTGFWDSTEIVLFDGASATTPGLLKLVPNSTESTFFASGLAYVSADIDVMVDGVPAVKFDWTAAADFVWAP